jgi:eukaryotic-like serine/threonine-protein kinase
VSPDQWRQIEQVYLAALDLAGEQRDALLAQTDPEVRHRVEAMLAQPDGSTLITLRAVENVAELNSPVITPGATLGQYRIEATIGEGGMGVVFRALDTKLGRPVAIKFLSDELADAAARRRFQREAQMASSLNHPNILTVYDAGEFEGRQYLVTEFVDGGTLRDWYKRQPRSWEDVAELLTGVADGLATAHDAGILHRDIKPANILVTASGYAKLADFGLAKLDTGLASGSATATLTEEQTRKGVVLGTLAYMSPEQASGQPLDARSDMFSFGVVLYEMLSGQRPFSGATNLELLQQVIHGKPAPLSDRIPEALRAIAGKALQKDPANRFASMREFVAALRSAQRHSSQELAVSSSGLRKWLYAAAFSLVAIAGLATAFVLYSRRTAPAKRLDYVPLTNFADSAVAPTLSPDGRMLAFIRGQSAFVGQGEVYVKLLPDGDPVRLTNDGSRKMGPLTFSPDGSRIAFTEDIASWDTWSVPVLGGEPRRMLANAEGLSWVNRPSQPARVLFSALTHAGLHMGLFTATESRSDQRTVYLPAETDGMAHRSFLSPDGKWVLLVEMNVAGWLPCRVVPFEGNSPGRRVGPQPAQCTDGAWTPDGKWLYVAANTGSGYHIWRQRFPDGTPEQVTAGATEEEGLSIAPDGKSFVTSVGESESTLWVHDARGERQITFEGYSYLPEFSRDNKRLYYLQRSKDTSRFVSGELWETDLDTGRKQRLLPDFLMAGYDISLDGRQVAFVTSDASGHAPLWIAALDGSSPPRRLTDQDCLRALISPNGEIFFVGGKSGELHLQAIRADGSGLRQVIPDHALFLYGISPDGKWVSAWVGEDINAYPTAGGPGIRVCAKCGSAGADIRGVIPPAVSWSADGKQLYVFLGETHTYAIPIPPGRVLPQIPAEGFPFRTGEKPSADAQPMGQARAFMSPDPAVYAYPIVNTHRNIYRIPIQ